MFCLAPRLNPTPRLDTVNFLYMARIEALGPQQGTSPSAPVSIKNPSQASLRLNKESVSIKGPLNKAPVSAPAPSP